MAVLMRASWGDLITCGVVAFIFAAFFVGLVGAVVQAIAASPLLIVPVVLITALLTWALVKA